MFYPLFIKHNELGLRGQIIYGNTRRKKKKKEMGDKLGHSFSKLYVK